MELCIRKDVTGGYAMIHDCLVSPKETNEIEYLDCSTPRGGEHGDMDDSEEERVKDHQATGDGQASVRP